MYAFGGLGYRNFLRSYSCYYRRPEQTDRFNYLLYPNGFRPQMTTNTSDMSTTIRVARPRRRDPGYDRVEGVGSSKQGAQKAAAGVFLEQVKA